jgi:hypothetical protein
MTEKGYCIRWILGLPLRAPRSLGFVGGGAAKDDSGCELKPRERVNSLRLPQRVLCLVEPLEIIVPC